MTNDFEDGAEGVSSSCAPFPVLQTFAQSAKVKVISGLVELSYVAGREGDDEWDWAEAAAEALGIAFSKVRQHHLQRVIEVLSAAFHAGQIDRVEQGSDRPFAVARAHATIYADEIDFPNETKPAAIESAAGDVAHKIACRHEIADAEAAWCAIKAFEEIGLDIGRLGATWVLNRATAGREEREMGARTAAERSAKLSVRAAEAMSKILGGAA